jgi:hypothetical protein
MSDFNRVTSQHSIAQAVRHCAIYALNGTDDTTSTFRKAHEKTTIFKTSNFLNFSSTDFIIGRSSVWWRCSQMLLLKKKASQNCEISSPYQQEIRRLFHVHDREERTLGWGSSLYLIQRRTNGRTDMPLANGLMIKKIRIEVPNSGRTDLSCRCLP